MFPFLFFLFMFSGSEAASFSRMTSGSDLSKGYLEQLGQSFSPDDLVKGDLSFEMDGSLLKQRESREDYLGNVHTRFDQYFGGLRVVGNQISFHNIQGRKANFVPSKGDWTENKDPPKEKVMERFMTCVKEARSKEPGRFVLSRRTLESMDKCVNQDRWMWKPDDWEPRIATSFTGNFIGGLLDDVGTFNIDDFDIKAKMTELKDLAKADGSSLQDRTDADVEELVIFLDPKDNNKAKLAYKTAFVARSSEDDFSKPEYYIDAITGDVLSKIDSLNNAEYEYYDGDYDEVGTGPGGNEKIGKYEFGSDHDKLLVAVDGDMCSFDTPYVKTIDLEGSNDVYESETAHSFACFEQAGDEENGGYSPLNDAHYYATKTLQMFAEWFGEDHPEIALPLIIKVHLGKWHGFFDGRNVVFGDYKDEAHPAASPDIVAHEICHVVTYYASKLEYSGASGALNEAFSDWGGKALEYYLNGKKVKNWKIGKDVIKEGNDPDALRCLDDPPCDGKSIDHVKDFNDDMEVHYSSGVWNKAFYEMTQKFKYDVWDMFDILYHANINYWEENETFEGGAEGVLSATEDLKNGASDAGSYWLDTQDIVDAFKVVGIECEKNGEDNWECSLAS